jgi:putative membrane protein
MASHPEQRAAEAQEKLADSADTLADSAVTQEDSADRRTKLASDRTLLAAERTYAAWMRTGLASLAAGVGAQSLLEDLVEPWLALATSLVLLMFSIFCFVAGIWRDLTGKALRPDPDTARLPSVVLVIFNSFLVLVGLAVLIGITTR